MGYNIVFIFGTPFAILNRQVSSLPKREKLWGFDFTNSLPDTSHEAVNFFSHKAKTEVQNGFWADVVYNEILV